MPARDVVEQRAMRGRGRRERNRFAQAFGRREAAREEPDGGGFHIAFAARDLPGKAQARHRLQPERRIEQPGRVQERVAMHAAQTRELGILQARDRAEDPQLLAVLQLRLEADHVEERAELVVLPELHDRVGLALGRMRVGEAERFQRPVPERFPPALGHDLDRQTAIEIRGRRFPVVDNNLVAGDERVDEGAVLLAGERTVDVVGARSAGTGLVVTRLQPGNRHVD